MKRKKKIGIVTKFDNINMGNRLQNYAVQEIYREFGFQAITLGLHGADGLRNKVGLKPYNDFMYYAGIFEKITKGSSRRYYFGKFNRHIVFPYTRPVLSRIKRDINKYNYFSVGSDQIWNPKFGYLKDLDLLTFSPKEKNISFSASIGLDSLEGECDTEFVKKAFLNFAHISVREQRAKEIIEEMTGRTDVEVFPDPTLLLPREKWQQIERGGGVTYNKKYIFIFFLSDIDKEARERLYRFAHENGYAILEWSPDHDSLKSKTGPSEWLSLVHHASYVCTDSFHACAFSLIYNVPFTVYQRKFSVNMHSRIETLISTFALNDIEYDGVVNIPTIDFDFVNQKLLFERERTYKTLREWLNLEG